MLQPRQPQLWETVPCWSAPPPTPAICLPLRCRHKTFVTVHVKLINYKQFALLLCRHSSAPQQTKLHVSHALTSARVHFKQHLKVSQQISLNTNRLQPIRLPTQCRASSHSLLVPSPYPDDPDAGRGCAFVSRSTIRVGIAPLVHKLLCKTFAFRALFMLARMPPRFAIPLQHLWTCTTHTK